MTNSTPPEIEPGALPVSPPKPKAGERFWLHLLFVGLVSLMVFVPGLNGYGVIDPSDGLYAEGAREMLERSDWVTPSSNYKPFFEKPILIYWMIMASYKLFDVHEFYARLPVALCGAFSAVALLVFARPFLGARAAFFAALALLSTPLFVTVGHVAITDVPLTLFMMLGALGLFSRLHGAHWISLAIAYGALGLALLIKGPVPVALVALILVFYLAWVRPKGMAGGYQWWWQRVILLHPFLGTVMMLSIAAPWYIAEGLATKGAFYHEFFINQNFGRAMGTVNHQNPFWFYIPVYLGGFFPWSILTLFEIRRYFSLLKKRWVLTRRASLELFAVLWLVLILALFTVLKTKLATYILPVAPAMAILSGSLLDRVVRFGKTRPLAWTLLVFVLLVFPLIVICAPAICFKLNIDIGTLYAFVGFGIFVWFFLVVATWAAFKKKAEAAITAIACACTFAAGTFVPTGLQSHYVRCDYPLFHLLRRVVRDKAQVALYMRDSPAVTFYLRRPIREIKTLLDYKEYVQAGKKPHYLLVTTDVMQQMKEPPPMWTLLEKAAKWHLFKIDPLE
ncbi:MAG: glycosyltransferase family 39 protein [Candidatus Melainabacteria bacterium]|nr:glycosyltransferase family 39 protein [Candidatus Melainabacteria bacterium]